MTGLTLMVDKMSPKRLTLALAFTSALVVGVTASQIASAATNGNPSWRPQSSERLVKLPASYLKKSIDHDFKQSELGLALQNTDENIGLKAKTLNDLQSAVGQSQGEVQDELRHQFLGEKRDYIQLMSQRNELKRKHLVTKRRLFETMLEKVADSKNVSPVRQELMDKQDEAMQRFESSFDKVDMRLFKNGMAADSKYGQKHHENVSAIEKLMSRIQGHRMNSIPEDDGRPLTHEEQLRRMASNVQAEIALLDQEEGILGYMAKLVALDAMALAEESLDAELSDSDTPGSQGPAGAVSFFMNN
ncbi:MAG: hypothetical protein OQJ97_15055 [Rhodospirillales bacterium]|nr:hypothetical protein [Rhodospirillales bacterium]